MLSGQFKIDGVDTRTETSRGQKIIWYGIQDHGYL